MSNYGIWSVMAQLDVIMSKLKSRMEAKMQRPEIVVHG